MSLHKLFPIVLFLLFPAMTLASDRRKPAAVQDDGPARISLKVSSQIFLTAPTPISVTIMVENPGEKYYCPAVDIEWGDGDRSYWEEDCPPFEEAEPTNFFSYTPQSDHIYRSVGPRTLTVKLLRSKKIIATINARINGYKDAPLD